MGQSNYQYLKAYLHSGMAGIEIVFFSLLRVRVDGDLCLLTPVCWYLRISLLHNKKPRLSVID